MLVISNRPRVSRLSDFEISCAITPWILLQSVQLLLLIILVMNKSDSCCAVVRFGYHSYDYRPNWTSPSSIAIMNVFNGVTSPRAFSYRRVLTLGFSFNLTHGIKTSSQWHQNCYCLQTILPRSQMPLPCCEDGGRAREEGKEKGGETAFRLSFASFPWSLKWSSPVSRASSSPACDWNRSAWGRGSGRYSFSKLRGS